MQSQTNAFLGKTQRNSSICSTVSSSSSHSAAQDDAALNYLNEVRRAAIAQKQLLQANSLLHATPADPVSDALTLALAESLQSRRRSALAANALAIQNILEVSQQQQSWLTAAANARLAAKTSMGGFPALY